jgi:hypothetical protein
MDVLPIVERSPVNMGIVCIYLNSEPIVIYTPPTLASAKGDVYVIVTNIILL